MGLHSDGASDTPSSRRPEAQKYSPDQPRVPAGDPDGGQWTDGGGGGGGSSSDGRVRVAQATAGLGVLNDAAESIVETVNTRAAQGRIQAQYPTATPAQIVRLHHSSINAQGLTARVRELDPAWRPTPSLRSTIEGAIAAAEAEAVQAQLRLAELLRDAIPSTNPSWGVNRLRKELNDRGYFFERLTDKPGFHYKNPATGERVRIMERPNRRYRTESDQKHNNGYYYRYQPGKGKQEGGHITIPNKRGSNE